MNKTKTEFLFEGSKMTAQDVGNFHYGVVGKATPLLDDETLLRSAGGTQIAAKTSNPEWQKFVEVPVPGMVTTHAWVLAPPYGDDPRDQEMIKNGFNYYSNNKTELKKPEED